jgi:proteasome lid subunit RPN8/RPN11
VVTGPPDPDAYYPGAAGLEHPGPAAVSLPAAIRDAIVDHARREVPNEACGIVVGDRAAADGGLALRWVPMRNAAASPYRYAIDPDDLLRLTIETDDADQVFWAIVHSHVASPARPSPTDLRESHYPDSLYVLVSLDSGEAEPATGPESLRAWRIVDGAVHEVALTVEVASAHEGGDGVSGT